MDEGSSETVTAELSIFDSLPYQVTHVKGDWIKVDPENNCYGTNTGTPLMLEVPRSPGLYVDLSNSFVEVQLNVVQGTAAHADVSYVNNVLHTLFKDVSLSLNNTKVEGENMNYSYKSYIYIAVNTSAQAKSHQLQTSGWLSDKAGQHDGATDEANEGHKVRKMSAASAKDLFLAGPLMLDLWMQDQYFPDNDFKLKFTRN